MKRSQELSADAAVTEAAEALARAIRESQEWRAFAHAQEEAEKDAQLSSSLARHRQLTQSNFGDPTGRTMSELAVLRDQIQRNPHYREQQDAGVTLATLLQKVNEALSAGLGLDFATNAAPRRSCCG